MPGVAKNTSPLAICLIGENTLIVCGTRFEIRIKNEQNAVKYNALKICPVHIVSRMLTIEVRSGISIICLTTGEKGLWRDNDL